MRTIAQETFHLARPCTRKRASIRRCIRLAKLHSIYTVIISRMPLMPSHVRRLFLISLAPWTFPPPPGSGPRPTKKRWAAVGTYLLVSLLDCVQRGRKNAHTWAPMRNVATSKYYRTACNSRFRRDVNLVEKSGLIWIYVRFITFFL